MEFGTLYNGKGVKTTLLFCRYLDIAVSLLYRTLQYLEEVSVGIAKEIASGKLRVDRKKKPLIQMLMDFGLTFNWVRNQIFGRAKKQVLKLSGGLYPAPLRVSGIVIPHIVLVKFVLILQPSVLRNLRIFYDIYIYN